MLLLPLQQQRYHLQLRREGVRSSSGNPPEGIAAPMSAAIIIQQYTF
jgi:hypothetical protein